MRRYSTPVLKFHLIGNALDEILKGTCYLTFGRHDITKRGFTPLFDAPFEVSTEEGETYLTATLTQEQTGVFEPDETMYVQFRSKVGNTSIVSSIATAVVGATIKNVVV